MDIISQMSYELLVFNENKITAIEKYLHILLYNMNYSYITSIRVHTVYAAKSP